MTGVMLYGVVWYSYRQLWQLAIVSKIWAGNELLYYIAVVHVHCSILHFTNIPVICCMTKSK